VSESQSNTLSKEKELVEALATHCLPEAKGSTLAQVQYLATQLAAPANAWLKQTI